MPKWHYFVCCSLTISKTVHSQLSQWIMLSYWKKLQQVFSSTLQEVKGLTANAARASGTITTSLGTNSKSLCLNTCKEKRVTSVFYAVTVDGYQTWILWSTTFSLWKTIIQELVLLRMRLLKLHNYGSVAPSCWNQYLILVAIKHGLRELLACSDRKVRVLFEDTKVFVYF